MVADRCGAERGVDWVGGSCIIGSDGFPLAAPVPADASRVLVAEVDPNMARDKRIGTTNPLFDDRRVDLYG